MAESTLLSDAMNPWPLVFTAQHRCLIAWLGLLSWPGHLVAEIVCIHRRARPARNQKVPASQACPIAALYARAGAMACVGMAEGAGSPTGPIARDVCAAAEPKAAGARTDAGAMATGARPAAGDSITEVK